MSAPVQTGPPPSGDGPVPSPDWDEVCYDLGDRIRAERLARRLSQTDLAERASMSPSTVKKLECGRIQMRPFLQACWAMGVQADALLSDGWTFPEREFRLSDKHTLILREAASGDSLTQVGARLGMDSRMVGANLSRIYHLLGVSYLPVRDRRAAAARVAMQHGLFSPENRTS